MNSYILLYLSCLFYFITSCNNDKIAKVKGVILHAEGKKLYLQKFNLGNIQTIDSTKLKKQGKFKFKISVTYPEYYFLKFSTQKFITLIVKPKDKIRLTSTFTGFNNEYKVDGSAESLSIKKLNRRFRSISLRLDSLANINRNEISTNKLKNKKETTSNALLTERQRFIEHFVKSIQAPMVGYYALYQQDIFSDKTIQQEDDLLFYRIVATSLKTNYPNSPYTKSIITKIENIQRLQTNERLKALISAKGKKYPDISLKNTEGKIIKLADFKNIVLIAFWSYKNNLSIAQNEVYKKIHRKYKKKGFNILHINVDPDQIKWKNYVKSNIYPFVNLHDAKDLLALKSYNIRQLPANYLIDPKEGIIGKNLFGIYLEEKLQTVFK